MQYEGETLNKIMYSIFVAVLFAVRIYSNSVHCIPKMSCYVCIVLNVPWMWPFLFGLEF